MAIESGDIRLAVRIETRHDVEVPSCFVKDIDGSFEMRFIDGLDNTGLTFENGDPAEGFDEGILIEDSLKGLSSRIDLTTGGNFNSINSFTITLDNSQTPPLWQRLLSNQVYLTNCKVTLYFVIDSVMYARGGGYLNATPYNEQHLVLSVKDINELLFKNIPEVESEQVAIGSPGFTELKKVTETNESVDKFFGAFYGEETDGNSIKSILEVWVPKSYIDEGKDFTNLWIKATNQGLSSERKITDDIGITEGYEIGSIEHSDMVQIISQEEGVREVLSTNGGDNKVWYRRLRFTLSSSIDSIKSDSVLSFADIERNSGQRSQYYDFPNWDALRVFQSTTPRNPPAIFEVVRQETRYQISESEIGDVEFDANGNPILYVYNEKSDSYLKIEDVARFENSEDGAYVTVYHIGEGEDRSTYTTINADHTSIDSRYSTFIHKDETINFNKDYNFDALIKEAFPSHNVFDGNLQDADQKIVTYRTTGQTNYAQNRITPFIEMDFNGLDWDAYDNMYLGVVMNVQGAQTTMHTVAADDNIGLFFSTRDALVAPHKIGSAGQTESEATADEVEKALTTTTNDCYFPIRINGAPSSMLLDAFDNEFYITPHNRGVVNAKRGFPSYYKSLLGSTVEKEFDYKTHFKLDNNPLKDGKMNLFIEPNAGIDCFNIGQISYKIQHVHLIGEKVISADKLFVKTTGEKLTSGAPVTNVYDAFKLMLEDKNEFTDVDYSNVPAFRNNWDCSRLIKSPTSSKELIKNLAEQSFVAVFTNRFGNLQLDAFRENFVGFDPITKPYHWVHDNDTTSNQSIKSVKTTNISKIYNNIDLRFHKEYFNDEFTENYFVKNASAASFPSGDYSSFSNVVDRTLAQELWGYGHETFIRNAIAQGLPANLANCEWYRDLSKDLQNGLGLSSSSIHYYLENLARWVTQSKNEITYDIDIDTDTIKVEIADRVSFSDILITDGAYIKGWVTSLKPDKETARITVGIITAPEDLVKPYDIIDELPDSTDAIDELAASSDTINEDFIIFP